ncbi:MAG: hypothetical protein WCJ61_17005, partial [Paludibacter sp.]
MDENLSIDGYDYMHQKTTGIETMYNMSVDFGSFFMGPLGLIYSPAMKQYPKILNAHPEFMYPGSNDYRYRRLERCCYFVFNQS